MGKKTTWLDLDLDERKSILTTITSAISKDSLATCMTSKR